MDADRARLCETADASEERERTGRGALCLSHLNCREPERANEAAQFDSLGYIAAGTIKADDGRVFARDNLPEAREIVGVLERAANGDESPPGVCVMSGIFQPSICLTYRGPKEHRYSSDRKLYRHLTHPNSGDQMHSPLQVASQLLVSCR
ncbi:hypothetical protein CUJ84_Chr002192 [Rhizobium leguminosarum]|uniref:Uncharacterized protein n=1 Tax=Rhizobium leguminosarum TaxID=384 RepID=A0A2K9Z2X3_RHILE|nr:hypothetical protein CUJ84_Chr002192 [Rhizobium leguminosarum]